jgi:hypothetical protein
MKQIILTIIIGSLNLNYLSAYDYDQQQEERRSDDKATWEQRRKGAVKDLKPY